MEAPGGPGSPLLTGQRYLAPIGGLEALEALATPEGLGPVEAPGRSVEPLKAWRRLLEALEALESGLGRQISAPKGEKELN